MKGFLEKGFSKKPLKGFCIWTLKKPFLNLLKNP